MPGLLPSLLNTAESHAVALRLEQSEDRKFLAKLYASTREEELQQTGWSEEYKLAFVTQQFEAQTLHYDRYYAGATRAIVLVDGQPVGRLYLLRMPGELRIVDVSLLPAHRGRKIGTQLIEAVFAEARREGAMVSIHVEAFNPARRLYRRLGFSEAGEQGVYVLMQCRPGTSFN